MTAYLYNVKMGNFPETFHIFFIKDLHKLVSVQVSLIPEVNFFLPYMSKGHKGGGASAKWTQFLIGGNLFCETGPFWD